MQRVLSFTESVRALGDRRYPVVFLFGFCSGLPWVLHGTLLTLWLQHSGFSRTTITLLGLIGTVYFFNWVLGPLLDQYRLPLLARLFGRYRAWLLLCQGGIVLLLLAMGFGDPTDDGLGYIALVALGIAGLSAVQDVAIDAYRITVFRADEMDAKMPYAAGFSTAGWWAGFGFIGGWLAVRLGGETFGLSWPEVYHVLALVYVGVILLVMAVPRLESDAEAEAGDSRRFDEKMEAPNRPPPPVQRRAKPLFHDSPEPDKESLKGGAIIQIFQIIAAVDRTLVKPFAEFFSRCGMKLAVAVLLLLLVFRLGEAMLGRVALLFYGEVGFTVDEIADNQKLFGGLVTAVFALLAAMVNTRFGVIRGLLVAGIAMSGANLLFALLAYVGPDTGLLRLTLFVDNFFQAFATVAFVSFISYFTSRTYTGTQYALMASFSNVGRTTLAVSSGAVVDWLEGIPAVGHLGDHGEWIVFFILTTIMIIPGLCLLLWVSRLMRR